MPDNTLLPCPFCGSAARFCDGLPNSRGRAAEFDVLCERCDISTPGGRTHATAGSAVAAWNTRPVSIIEQRVRELEEALRAIANDASIDRNEQLEAFCRTALTTKKTDG